jgi:DNA-binding PadR family transcriptional regulator
MRLDERIYAYLEKIGERSSLEIKDAMSEDGVWFAHGRVSYRLDKMVTAGLLERRVTSGGLERGFRDRSYYKCKTVLRSVPKPRDVEDGLISSTKVPRWG